MAYKIWVPELIISGGQSGSDFGGLLAAERLKIPTGGVAPKGFRTENGPNLELGTRFGLIESDSEAYNIRTRQNIELADAVLIIARDFRSPGTVLTQQLAFDMHMPFFNLEFPFHANLEWKYWYDDVRMWLYHIRPAVLMVAGNRQSKAPGIQNWTFDTICKIFIDEASPRL